MQNFLGITIHFIDLLVALRVYYFQMPTSYYCTCKLLILPLHVRVHVIISLTCAPGFCWPFISGQISVLHTSLTERSLDEYLLQYYSLHGFFGRH